MNWRDMLSAIVEERFAMWRISQVHFLVYVYIF